MACWLFSLNKFWVVGHFLCITLYSRPFCRPCGLKVSGAILTLSKSVDILNC